MLNQELSLTQFPLFPVETESQKKQDDKPTVTPAHTSTRFSRREYNKNYYQMNKKRICEKKKNQNQMNVPMLIEKIVFSIKPSLINWRKISKWTEILTLIGLSILMTQYLVREAAEFYIDGHEGVVSAYLKAAMVEGIAILFSFSRGKGRILQWAQRVVMVLLCGLTLWTMSGKVVRSAVADTSKFRTMTQSIRDLESELRQKEHLREKLMKHDWIGATRRSDKELTSLRLRLSEMRQILASSQSPHVVMNGLGILIAFRLLIVAANLICIHLVMEQIGCETRRKGATLAVV